MTSVGRLPRLGQQPDPGSLETLPGEGSTRFAIGAQAVREPAIDPLPLRSHRLGAATFQTPATLLESSSVDQSVFGLPA